MKVSLIIFTLNEIEGMKVIMPQIKDEWCDELIIVDGNSTDGTIQYARDHGYRVYVQKKPGTGAAFCEAMEQVAGDIIISFTPDGNSLPEKIPELVEEIRKGHDLVIASRYFKGARSYDDTLISGFGNRLFTAIINLLFGSRISDSLVSYIAFRKNLYDELTIGETSSWNVRLLLRCLRAKKKIHEISADEPARIGGESKTHPLRNGLWVLQTILEERFRK